MNEYILKLSDLTKSYKKGLGFKRFYGLKHFSLEIQRGEVLGVIGPNGAGKTTTFKLILGLIHPDRGSVQFGPALARNGAEPKAKIGFLPENPYFYSYLTVEESLDFYGRLFAFTAAERKRKVEALLERVNMTHARKRPLGKVSRGMLQRVGIAQALINDPELLILDEPMSGLDPIGRKEIRDIIIDYGRQGKTVIFSSHILSDVEMICDRVAMIMDGQLKASGATDTVLDQGAREWEIEYAGPALEMDALAPRGTWRIDQKGRKQIIRVYEEPVALRLMDAIRAVEGGKLLAFNPKRAALENIYASTAGVTRDA